jgi:hypothetical protein
MRLHAETTASASPNHYRIRDAIFDRQRWTSHPDLLQGRGGMAWPK